MLMALPNKNNEQIAASRKHPGLHSSVNLSTSQPGRLQTLIYHVQAYRRMQRNFRRPKHSGDSLLKASSS